MECSSSPDCRLVLGVGSLLGAQDGQCLCLTTTNVWERFIATYESSSRSQWCGSLLSTSSPKRRHHHGRKFFPITPPTNSLQSEPFHPTPSIHSSIFSIIWWYFYNWNRRQLMQTKCRFALNQRKCCNEWGTAVPTRNHRRHHRLLWTITMLTRSLLLMENDPMIQVFVKTEVDALVVDVAPQLVWGDFHIKNKKKIEEHNGSSPRRRTSSKAEPKRRWILPFSLFITFMCMS